MEIETRAIRTGNTTDSSYGSVIPPIYPASCFRSQDPIANTGTAGYRYTRLANPSRQALEDSLVALEGGAGAIATASGMAAISNVFLLLSPGDHVVVPREIYSGTHGLLCDILRRLHIEATFVANLNDKDELKASLRSNTKLVWLETPGNPLLQITDIGAVCHMVRECYPSVLLAADNTFASPCLQNPLELGCDVVVHSTTKYINGHSDVIGGAVVAKDEETLARLQEIAVLMGLTESPFDAWLVLRGCRTLPQRMRSQQANAQQIAILLQEEEAVDRVYYPGLPSHPGYKIAQQQMRGPGAMLSIKLNPNKADAVTFLQSLQCFDTAVSLGGVESLAQLPWTMSHNHVSDEEKEAMGLTPHVVRLSIGLEHPNDLSEDLTRALRQACC